MIKLHDKVENCDMPVPDSFGKEYGWICPVCGKGLAPWMSVCPCVNKNNTVDDISKRIYYNNPMVGYKFDELDQFNSQINSRPYNGGIYAYSNHSLDKEIKLPPLNTGDTLGLEVNKHYL